MIALMRYEADLCRCGYPRQVAWHPDMAGGWFEPRAYLCHACTARTGDDVVYEVAVDTRHPDHLDLPPFDLDDALIDSHSRGNRGRPHRQEVDASVG